MGAHPIVWWALFSEDMSVSLVSWSNPTGMVTNSDIELAYRVIHHTYMEDCYDVQEQTILSWKDNMAGLWWQRKGSATSTSLPDHLLRLQTIHQRFHRYVT